jgi:hypothetical protein
VCDENIFCSVMKIFFVSAMKIFFVSDGVWWKYFCVTMKIFFVSDVCRHENIFLSVMMCERHENIFCVWWKYFLCVMKIFFMSCEIFFMVWEIFFVSDDVCVINFFYLSSWKYFL